MTDQLLMTIAVLGGTGKKAKDWPTAGPKPDTKSSSARARWKKPKPPLLNWPKYSATKPLSKDWTTYLPLKRPILQC